MKDLEKKINEILEEMTLEEKIALCSGKDNWHTKGYEKYGIPSVMVSDGPNGLRKQEKKGDAAGINRSVPATCFPAASLSACSWDEDLLRREGRALAQEAGKEGVSMILGPGMNIKRNPLCGRNFEYFSEDPLLAGKMAAAFVSGVQEKGIGACLKHFACNSQEYFRMVSDSRMDERTLREIYLSAFEYAIKHASPYGVMCSYNKINGTYASENKKLLSDILRKEWGYEDLLVTDWGAIDDRSFGFEAGCDLAMPGGSGWGEKAAAENVKSKKLEEKYIDKSASRVLKFAFKAEEALKGDFSFSKEDHHALCAEIAAKSAVLLENKDNVLPLKKEDKICFIGDMAEHPRFQGSGSSHINPTVTESVRDLWPEVPFARGCQKDGSSSDELIEEAKKTAAAADKTIIFAGLPETYESEGMDRRDMKMPEGHVRLIEEMAAVSKKVIVILFGGSPMEIPWADKVSAILYMGLPGQGGSRALVSLLRGEINPSGKLAESWPYVYSDCISSSYYGKEKNAEYLEGIYVGYRYYDTAEVPVRWPFGYGLSYTEFDLSGLKTDKNKVSVSVTNSGKVFGEEVTELYIGKRDSAFYRPLRELKGFKKTALEPGQTKEVSFELSPEDFRLWDEGWKIEKGEYEIYAGGGIKGKMLKGSLYVSEELFSEISQGDPERTKEPSSGREAVNMEQEEPSAEISFISSPSLSSNRESWYFSLKGKPSRNDWEELMGEALPAEDKNEGFTVNSSMEEAMEKNGLFRFIYWIYEKYIALRYKRGTVMYEMMMASLRQVTFRAMQTSTGIKLNLAQALALIADGKTAKGLRQLFRS